MLEKREIEQKAQEFGIHTANVERDYIFGWLLAGIYSISELKDELALKGGNCFRKGYFQNTRFSRDLDFSIQTVISEKSLLQELNNVCNFVQRSTQVTFEKGLNQVKEERSIDSERKVYEARLYFKGFYGQEKIIIKIPLDVTQFDRVHLPVQNQHLIHPYSDADKCPVEIRCVKLEELVANKLKCLLQRRHSLDLYDYVYSIFVNKDIEINKSEVVKTFLKKTIFESSPGAAISLLLELPFEIFRSVWSRYLICPERSVIKFDFAIEKFKQSVKELFGSFPRLRFDLKYFPPKFRNPIMEAGHTLTLVEVVYDGYSRIVEPYSLSYKIRKDGVAREYLYVYDRTGGRSGPGIKCFVADKIRSIKNTKERFEPRYPVELSRASEYGDKRYFSSRSSALAYRVYGSQAPSVWNYSHGITYVVECLYCGKRFRRKKHDTRLRNHKDSYGNPCFGRVGEVVDEVYS